MRARFLAVLLAALPGVAWEARWTVPVLGAVFDSASKSIRPVVGVPGSASLGHALATPEKAGLGFIAPGEAAAVLAGADHTVLLSWTGEDARFVPLDKSVQPVAASWNGRRVALYNGAATVQIWEGATLVESRTTEAIETFFSLCDDGRILPGGVCEADGDYVIDQVGLVRVTGNARHVVATGSYSVVAGRRGFVAAAGSELVIVTQGNELHRLSLSSPALSLAPLRPPGLFVLQLEDGSIHVYSAGALQMIERGRR